ncbi:MAG: DUF4292 domain-containing protein [Bacteroidota bacterium]
MPQSASVTILYISCIFLILGSFGCKGSSNLTTNKQEKKWREILEKAGADRVDYETLSISGKVNIKMPGGPIENLNASYQIFMSKDSLMLIRIRKFVEAARILVTPDSIFIRNNLEQSFIISDYSLAEEQTGFKANMRMLQDLLIGNFYPIPDQLMGEPTDSDLKQTFKGMKAGTTFTYDITLPAHKVSRIETDNPVKGQHAKIQYGDFTEISGRMMPQNTSIDVSAPETILLDFQHKKIETNPARISFKFSIPDGYTRVEMD